MSNQYKEWLVIMYETKTYLKQVRVGGRNVLTPDHAWEAARYESVASDMDADVTEISHDYRDTISVERGSERLVSHG